MHIPTLCAYCALQSSNKTRIVPLSIFFNVFFFLYFWDTDKFASPLYLFPFLRSLCSLSSLSLILFFSFLAY
jgi:hypothetical protein